MPRYRVKYELTFIAETTVEAASEDEAVDLVGDDATTSLAEKDIGFNYDLVPEFFGGSLSATVVDDIHCPDCGGDGEGARSLAGTYLPCPTCDATGVKEE